MVAISVGGLYISIKSFSIGVTGLSLSILINWIKTNNIKTEMAIFFSCCFVIL